MGITDGTGSSEWIGKMAKNLPRIRTEQVRAWFGSRKPAQPLAALEQGLKRQLELLRAEQSAHDPPPLTPERLRALLLSFASSEPDDQRWAEDELHLWEEPYDPSEDDIPDDVWAERTGDVA